jgi:hypothetical protein
MKEMICSVLELPSRGHCTGKRRKGAKMHGSQRLAVMVWFWLCVTDWDRARNRVLEPMLHVEQCGTQSVLMLMLAALTYRNCYG